MASLDQMEIDAIKSHVLVRGQNPFSYYGQKWDGTWALCKEEQWATPVKREEAEKIVAANINACAYMVPITHAQAMHLARCWPK